MLKTKLLVFCLDALCSLDLEYMRTLPHLGRVIAQGSYVHHVQPVYPSLTYPCHVSILTGNYVQRHGVPHNAMVRVGDLAAPWYNQRSAIQGPTLLDAAKAQGYHTCALSWPVTGGADFDLNMPMIVPLRYTGSEPISFFKNNATEELLERYYPLYFQHLIGPDRSLDAYTMALALDILRDYHQPDVMLVKMCDLDSVRHAYGIDNDQVKEQLRVHDQQFGQIVEQVRAHGEYANTNFVILGDHGQADITQTLNVNILLRQHGFLTVGADGKLADYDAYCHSAELSAWVRLKDPDDAHMSRKVYDFLLALKADPQYGLGHVLTKAEVAEKYHLSGPFDFVLEGERAVSFGNTFTGDDVFASHPYKQHAWLMATHGGLPSQPETTTFIASGPSVKPGVVVERGQLVDDAPTMAAMLGFELPGVDGRVISEMLR